ncbi:thioredoxin family protein [Hymenobacter aerilatus]|uniref:Thioredoxin family protein n=1 Tax=Hymenobacter aerilatus TaxID=2932251 RepID=A0A8T9SXI2_9BACT|nr:thioredoxin family protein [Hymenobacter aerilatus]UOR04900.1 thioredoxin family protein [Hymenobacter aerilatus]
MSDFSPPTPTPVLPLERLEASYSYTAYRQLVDDLLAQGKTTGPQQTEELVQYTKLNEQRMSRLDKTTHVLPALADAAVHVPYPLVWLILTEGWCGDAAQIVPVLEHVAEASAGNIRTRYLLRDENLDLMDRYLTGTSRAIPRLIVLRADTLKEVAQWGPRPAPAQELLLRLKAEGLSHEEYVTQIHTWYAHDKTQTLQQEMLELLQSLPR